MMCLVFKRRPTEALDVDPYNTVARHNLAVILDQHLNRPDEALRMYQRALELDPEVRTVRPYVESPKHAADLHCNLGLLYETRLGKRSEALRHYRRALIANSTCYSSRRV